MRCASPPDSDSAERPSVRYSSPTSLRNRSRSRTSLRMGAAISGSSPGLPLPRTGTFSKKVNASVIDSCNDVADVLSGERDRQRFGLQAPTAARRARARLHVLLELQPNGVGLRLIVAALDVGDDPFPVRARRCRSGGRLCPPYHREASPALRDSACPTGSSG